MARSNKLSQKKSDQIITRFLSSVILGDPIHATAWFSSRDSFSRLSWGRSLPCWIDAFSSESLCGFPLSLSCCHRSLHILPSATAFSTNVLQFISVQNRKGLKWQRAAQTIEHFINLQLIPFCSIYLLMQHLSPQLTQFLLMIIYKRW